MPINKELCFLKITFIDASEKVIVCTHTQLEGFLKELEVQRSSHYYFAGVGVKLSEVRFAQKLNDPVFME